MSHIMPAESGDTNPTTVEDPLRSAMSATAILLAETRLWHRYSPEDGLRAVRMAAKNGGLPHFTCGSRLVFRESELLTETAIEAFRAQLVEGGAR